MSYETNSPLTYQVQGQVQGPAKKQGQDPLKDLTKDKTKLSMDKAQLEQNTVPAIDVKNVSKRYQLFADPIDRLKQFFMPRVHHVLPFLGKAQYFESFWSIKEVSLQMMPGEVMGVIGLNGAGKSSLLQLICGVLSSTTGEVHVRGRVAALLELGAGFNPDFTGRENISLNATLLGLSSAEIRQKTDEIIEFSGIEAFIDQPVKTYSSGMYVRLAFSIATSVEPDILVIDEALSVGDGAFARKSFDRIMQLKSQGVTILFCSHNIYQVEALCQKAIWLHQGEVRAQGEVRSVCMAYNDFLNSSSEGQSPESVQFNGTDGLASFAPKESNFVHFEKDKSLSTELDASSTDASLKRSNGLASSAKLLEVKVLAGGSEMKPLSLQSDVSDLDVLIRFRSALDVPVPNVGVIITDKTGRNISSCSNFYDKIQLHRDDQGLTQVRLSFPQISLLRGRYGLSVYLLCEQAIHIYDSASVTEFEVAQPGLELGLVSLKRHWHA